MALPAGWTTRQVVQTYTRRDDSPATGRVEFHSQNVYEVDGVTVVPKVQYGELDENGALDVEITTTDTTADGGLFYTVYQVVSGLDALPFSFLLEPGVDPVVLAQHTPGGGSGGSGGAVDSVNGQTGVVVLDAADVGADPAGTAAALIAGLDPPTWGEITGKPPVEATCRNGDGTWPARPAGVTHVNWYERNFAVPLAPPGMVEGDLYFGPDGMTGVTP